MGDFGIVSSTCAEGSYPLVVNCPRNQHRAELLPDESVRFREDRAWALSIVEIIQALTILS